MISELLGLRSADQLGIPDYFGDSDTCRRGVSSRVVWSYFMMGTVYGVPSLLVLPSRMRSKGTHYLRDYIAPFVSRYKGHEVFGPRVSENRILESNTLVYTDECQIYSGYGREFSDETRYKQSHVGDLLRLQRKFSIENLAAYGPDKMMARLRPGVKFAIFFDPSCMGLYSFEIDPKGGRGDSSVGFQMGMTFSAYLPGRCQMLPDHGEWID